MIAKGSPAGNTARGFTEKPTLNYIFYLHFLTFAPRGRHFLFTIIDGPVFLIKTNMDYEKYKDELLRMHNDLGLLSAYTETKQEYYRKNRKDFLAKEAWARYILACVFLQVAPKEELHQHPHFDTFDADIESGGTIVQVEAKCRNFGSDKYATDKISVGKGDEIITEGGFLTIFFNDDGVYRVYDLSKYRPEKSRWEHSHYTAKSEDLPNYRHAEECWVLEPSKALFTGRLVRRNGA